MRQPKLTHEKRTARLRPNKLSPSKARETEPAFLPKEIKTVLLLSVIINLFGQFYYTTI
jgi:hypothetical protein